MGLKNDEKTEFNSLEFAFNKISEAVQEARTDDKLNFYIVADALRHFSIRLLIEAKLAKEEEVLAACKESVEETDDE